MAAPVPADPGVTALWDWGLSSIPPFQDWCTGNCWRKTWLASLATSPSSLASYWSFADSHLFRVLSFLYPYLTFHKNNLIDKKRISFQSTGPNFCLESGLNDHKKERCELFPQPVPIRSQWATEGPGHLPAQTSVGEKPTRTWGCQGMALCPSNKHFLLD